MKTKASYGEGTNAIEEFVNLYMQYQDKINEFYSKDDWDGLIAYINGLPTKDDHWLTMQLAWAFILKEDYRNAKQKIREALLLHDDCVMVPFLSGLVFLQDGDHKTAITFLQMVVDLKAETIAEYSSCPCCAEEHQAQSLLADAHFLLSGAYAHLGLNDLATQHRKIHAKAIRKGVRSAYKPKS